MQARPGAPVEKVEVAVHEVPVNLPSVAADEAPLKDRPLQMVPSMQTTWKHWRRLQADTRVAVVKGAEGRPYLYRNRKPGTPRSKEPAREHDTSVLGLGVVVDGEAVFFPFRQLERVKTPLGFAVGDTEIFVHFSKEGLTAWAEDSRGRLLNGVLAYADGWMDFYPKSRVFGRDWKAR